MQWREKQQQKNLTMCGIKHLKQVSVLEVTN